MRLIFIILIKINYILYQKALHRIGCSTFGNPGNSIGAVGRTFDGPGNTIGALGGTSGDPDSSSGDPGGAFGGSGNSIS